MKKIIGFAGRKRRGKGVLTEVIKTEEKNTVVITVANYLKLLCCDILGTDLNTLNERKDNGYSFELYPDEKWYKIISERADIPFDIVKNEISDIKFVNIRQMLQVIGTDLIRKYNYNWHVNSMVNDINSYSDDHIIIVDDVRFPNELQAIKKLGGEVFFIIRPNYFNEISNHISEISLKWTDFDYSHILINDLSKQSFINYFLIYYKFENTINNPIFMSNHSEYHEDGLFKPTAFLKNDWKYADKILHDIITYNKTNPLFIEKGLLKIIHNDESLCSELITCDVHLINNKCLTIYNPLINENLKQYF